MIAVLVGEGEYDMWSIAECYVHPTLNSSGLIDKEFEGLSRTFKHLVKHKKLKNTKADRKQFWEYHGIDHNSPYISFLIKKGFVKVPFDIY